MTMRAAWWVLRLLWRAGARAVQLLTPLPAWRRSELEATAAAAPVVVPRGPTTTCEDCGFVRITAFCSELCPRCGRRSAAAAAVEALSVAAPAWSMGGQLDTDERPPRANLLDWLEGKPDDVVDSIRQLAKSYEGTFCGECGAGPDNPTSRCPACLRRLEGLVARSTNDELGRLRDLVKRGAI